MMKTKKQKKTKIKKLC